MTEVTREPRRLSQLAMIVHCTRAPHHPAAATSEVESFGRDSTSDDFVVFAGHDAQTQNPMLLVTPELLSEEYG